MPPKTKVEMAAHAERVSFWKYEYTVRNEQFQKDFETLRKKVERVPGWPDSKWRTWVEFMFEELRPGEGGEIEEYARLFEVYEFNNIQPATSAEDIIKKLAAGEALKPHTLSDPKSPVRPPKMSALTWDGDTPYMTLDINLDAPMRAILAQVKSKVGFYRDLAEDIKQIRVGQKKIKEVKTPTAERIKQTNKEIGFANIGGRVTSQTDSDSSRAIGLWLYDYTLKTGASNSLARRKLGEVLGDEVAKLKPNGYDDPVADWFVRKTKGAIFFMNLLLFHRVRNKC